MTSKERAKDKRLWKEYRWTLKMYNALGEFQGWRCAGCGKHRDEKKQNLDHQHFHIVVHRVGLNGIVPGNTDSKWMAEVSEFPDIRVWGMTKKAVVMEARNKALPRSVRGILCAGRWGLGCNTKLGRADDPVWMKKMIIYLENPPAKQVLND